MGEQNPFYRVPPDLVAEVGQRTADPRVAPSRILDGHLHNQLGNRLGRQRPTTATVGAAVVFLGDQSSISAQDGVRRDDAGHLRQDPAAELLSAHGETTPLSIRQAERSTAELLSENAILFPKIVDQIFLVTIQPARDRKDEEVQRMRHPVRLSAFSATLTQDLWPSFGTLRGSERLGPRDSRSSHGR